MQFKGALGSGLVLAFALSALSAGCASRQQSSETAARGGNAKSTQRAIGLTLTIPNLRRDWAGLVSLFPDTEEYQPIRQIGMDVLLPVLAGSGLDSHLRLDQPVYAFMFSEETPPPGRGSALLSVALDNCEATLADLGADEYQTFATHKGVTGFEAMPGKATVFDPGSGCEVWPVPSGACRLICGTKADLAAYPTERLVTAVVPPAQHGDWLYASFNLAQLKQEAFGTLLAPRTAGERIGQALALDAVDELENLALGLSGAKDDLLLHLDFEFKSSRNLLNGTFIGRPVDERVEDAFLDLPEESLFAMRLSGMQRGQLSAEAQALFTQIMEGSPESKDANRRQELLAGLGKLFFSGGPSIWAWGFDVPRARAELRRFFRGQGDESSRTGQVARAWQPWAVFGLVEKDGAAWLAELDRLITLSGVPPLAPQGAATETPHSSFRRPPPEGTPQGTRYFVSRRRSTDAKGTAGSASEPAMHFLLAPKGAMVWGCIARAVEPCVLQLSTISSKRARTLRETPWAAGLKAAHGSLVGVTSPLALAALMAETEDAKSILGTEAALQAMSQLPDDGDFPVIASGQTTLSASGRATLRVSTKFPRAAIPYELFDE
jgi:hypothetical protein